MLGKLNVLLMVIRESGLLVATGSCWTSMMIFLSSLVHSLISQCLCEQTNLPRAFLVHVRSLSSSNAILLKPYFLGETRSAGIPFWLLRCFLKPCLLRISFSELDHPVPSNKL